MQYDDPRWKVLAGGYGLPYDPTAVLRQLEVEPTSERAWRELWNELHHQGDVGEASYATVPALVRIQKAQRRLGWNLYALAATIEVERHRKTSPRLPDWLEPDYREAWQLLLGLALDDLASTVDPLVVQSALAVVALARHSVKLGVLLAYLDTSEVDALVEDRCAWSTLYVSDS